MAFIVQNSITKVRFNFGISLFTSYQKNNTYTRNVTRFLSTEKNNNNNVDKEQQTQIKKSVFISQSYDVFTNLALEDWIYKNFNFSNHHVLMLWTNNPTVVIGRHQNPFVEANITNLTKNNIEIARRNSGGGAVYHDRGNLNCTFFTPRDRYNRKYNLNLLTRALYREYGIKAEISARDDITVNGKKISGTAAKLGQPNAYHHCTLLVNSNKLHLNESLVKDETEIIGKATASVRSPIKNLADVNRNVNVPQLLSAIGYEFLRTSAIELNDGGRDLLMQQRGFQLINPTEKWFPGIDLLREQFLSWDWRYGKTPKFTVQKEIQLKSENQMNHNVTVKINVEKGIIMDISLVMSQTTNNSEPIPVLSNQITKEYSEDSLNGIINALKGVKTDNIQQAMNMGL